MIDKESIYNKEDVLFIEVEVGKTLDLLPQTNASEIVRREIINGDLPPGIILDVSSGYIYGIVLAFGIYEVTLRVATTEGGEGEKTIRFICSYYNADDDFPEKSPILFEKEI